TAPTDGAEQIVRNATAGARLLTARGAVMRVVSILSNLALFALVTPADFGLLAVVRGITALAGNTTDLGFAWALIRREHSPSRGEYGALNGIQLAGTLAILALVVARPSIVTTFGALDPGWRWWMLATLACTVVVPFGVSAKIRIERAMDYRKVAFYDVSSVLLLNLSLLGFALAGKFAIGVFIATGGTMLYSNLLLCFWSPGPGPSFRLAQWKRLFRELAGFSAGHVGYLLYTSATPIVVAHFFGLSGAGIWSFATRLGNIIQMAFEGFRRATVPAASRLVRLPEQMRSLVENSLLGSARFTIPMVAAMVAGLPVIGYLWPRWEPAVLVGQLYVIGFGLTGTFCASLVPAAVAMKGSAVAIAEQGIPVLIGWSGFALLALLGSQELAWVVIPMHLITAIVLWQVTDAVVRPRWNAEIGGLLVGLVLVTLLTVAGQILAWPVLFTPVVAGVVFLAVWLWPRVRAPLRAIVPEGEGR
ncbi:MAG TPA: oligosaccharide flippase family protein, partial [Gemmatimonadales bacterium]|nr:oligosaccharide flippase family protein [Gemmatimonadales bacterium]